MGKIAMIVTVLCTLGGIQVYAQQAESADNSNFDGYVRTTNCNATPSIVVRNTTSGEKVLSVTRYKCLQLEDLLADAERAARICRGVLHVKLKIDSEANEVLRIDKIEVWTQGRC